MLSESGGAFSGMERFGRDAAIMPDGRAPADEVPRVTQSPLPRVRPILFSFFCICH